ncbi:MAG TPA: TIGR02452 family protein, partial [Armatimonadota bacterium]|nr:TIGR02452 family protein [Armatimonadota bacterium]
GSVLITPEELRPLRARADRAIAARGYETTFEVRNETTLAAAHRLVARLGPERVAALNFASARNPGGGFLNGSQAQEESLARASALHACLERQPAFYEANRRGRSLLYTDHMIVAPRVVVFRDDHDRLLEEPWEVTLVTAPAPNAGAIAKNEPASSRQIEPAFRRRIEGVLSATVAFNQSALVLGAWGCGVFGNEPATVARLFGDFLLGDGPFARAFAHVTFAVLDRHGEIIAPFTEVFGGHGASQPAPK